MPATPQRQAPVRPTLRLAVAVAVAAVAGLALSGCDRGAVPDEGPLPTDTLFPAAWIGVVDGSPELMFSEITSVAADAEGRVFVGDRAGATIRMYDPWGDFLGELARAGDGPGEIAGWPADLVVDAEGRLVVRDANRVTWIDPHAGRFERVYATWNLPGFGNLAHDRSRVTGDGRYLYPASLFARGEPPRHFYLPFDLGTGSSAGDTIPVPPLPGLVGFAWYPTGPSGGRLLPGLERVPFAPVPSWAVRADGIIVSSDGSHAPLLLTGPGGDTVGRIPLPGGGSRPIPAEVRADSLAALQARLDSVPVPLDQVQGLGEGVAERRLPEQYPGVLAVHVAEDGAIWVERWSDDPRARLFDVLEPEGGHRARYFLAAPLLGDPPPWFGVGHVVGVAREPETGVERVVRFEIR
jgi:hypothetical protein